MVSKCPYGYTSPRWSGEICDCSMPMTFDTYSSCSYNCLYCFAYYQKSHTVHGYKGIEDSTLRNVKSVNPEKVIQLFENSLNMTPSNQTEEQFAPYIHDRITMQWGGMGDAFDEFEREYGVSLKLLKYFDKIDYPLSISTKAAWFTEDKRYMKLLKKHQHNWHFKISIITTDEQKSKIIEEYCPTPTERFQAMKNLTDIGLHVTLRLRPYIIGLSDYEKLIPLAKKNGADSVTTEFFCLETRADKNLKNKYQQMSKTLGYDILEFYKKHSKGAGYKRLNYNLKKDLIIKMKELTHKNHMLFYVSDAHHKEKCDTVCCCGTPPRFKVYTGHYAQALQIAKRKGIIKWSQISPITKKYTNHYLWERAIGFNTGTNKQRALRKRQTMYDYLREIWNTPKNGKSPYKYFSGVLYPVGLDENHDVIYKYDYDKAKG